MSSASDAASSPAAAAAAPPKQPQPRRERYKFVKVPSRLMSARCPDVVLQLVLQFLDTKSKLSAARASVRMRAMALTPFSWKDAELFTLNSSTRDFGTKILQRPLLRHAPICFRVIRGVILFEQHVLNIPQLHTLLARYCIPQECERILASPHVQHHLRVLQLPQNAPPELLLVLAATSSLPHLHTLSFTVGLKNITAQHVAALAAAPALTSVQMRAWRHTSYYDCPFEGLLALRQLKSLALHTVRLDQALLAVLRSSNLAATLQHLILADMLWQLPANNEAHEDADGVFDALVHLHSLALLGVSGVSLNMLLARPLPASLELLHVLLVTRFDVGGAEFDLRPATLRDVLRTTPRVHVHLLVDTTVADSYRDMSASGAALNHRTGFPDIHDLAAISPERVHIQAKNEVQLLSPDFAD
jgi:hypothetical protein